MELKSQLLLRWFSLLKSLDWLDWASRLPGRGASPVSEAYRIHCPCNSETKFESPWFSEIYAFDSMMVSR